jgi:hypothetical protein
MNARHVITLIALPFSQHALAQIAYPGYTWGTITFPNSVMKNSGKELDNVALDMKVEQGIDWFKFGQDSWRFNTYISLRVAADNQGLDYNNKVSPALGFKIRRDFDQGILDFGVQAVQERRWKIPTKSSGYQAYASWWFGWGSPAPAGSVR